MKLIGIIFYDETSINFMNDYEYNISFLYNMKRYINDLLRNRGYVYLRQIYEILGIEWDHINDNICVKYDIETDNAIEFEIFVIDKKKY